MDKQEKVIEGLEHCLQYNMTGKECIRCPYSDECGTDGEPMMRDALALLKEQRDKIKALRQLVDWAEECGFGLDNIPWYEYVTEEELDSVDGYVEQMIYIARKAVSGNA
ncbi:MAG: hypothetical protein J6W84_01675 [Bacteroidales bacterium]|nr:hypothetical protein [Bacteroidales bacterium]